MQSQQIDIEVHPLFLALTRPAMTMGVTLEYHLLNLMLSVISFIAMGNLLYLLTFVPVHLFGCAMFRYDVNFFAIKTKATLYTGSNRANKNLWGVGSYEPF